MLQRQLVCSLCVDMTLVYIQLCFDTVVHVTRFVIVISSMIQTTDIHCSFLV